MHKILALSTITGFLFLLTSITSIAFEDKKIDAKNNISSQDIFLSNYIIKEGRSILLIFNKWDLIKNLSLIHI